jgi:hypothetical protein
MTRAGSEGAESPSTGGRVIRRPSVGGMPTIRALAPTTMATYHINRCSSAFGGEDNCATVEGFRNAIANCAGRNSRPGSTSQIPAIRSVPLPKPSTVFGTAITSGPICSPVSAVHIGADSHVRLDWLVPREILAPLERPLFTAPCEESHTLSPPAASQSQRARTPSPSAPRPPARRGDPRHQG